ncbi:MAG: Na/Pi symporter [Calditrichia bacterium]
MQRLKSLYKKNQTLLSALSLLLFLYLFFLSLELMGSSLKMFGKEFAKVLIENTSNPFVGLFIGILATSLIQSSSSTTSIVVGMVAGGVLNIANAIPIIMGANIGTSVTNTIASLAQINRSNEFQRSFSAAIVHDYFNLLAVLVFFPLQIFTNYLGHGATFLATEFQHIGGTSFLSPVKAITKPVAHWMISTSQFPIWVILLISLALLLFSLKKMVDSLKVLVVKRAEALFDRYLFKTEVRAFFVGLLLTILVQSSSITTSLVVPLAGAGLLTLEQLFPYTLGANIGTTITAMLAALITQNISAIIVAFSHLLFNISGILVFWPLKFLPIKAAKTVTKLAIKNKIFPIAYVLILFFIIPGLVILLGR